jgi:hypothetical protein
LADKLRAADRAHPIRHAASRASDRDRPTRPHPRWTPAWIVLCVAVTLTACATRTDSTRPTPAGAISELNLLGLPMAVNLDEQPGADGVVVKLFAVSLANPRAVPIRSGTLELIAYPGSPNPAALPPPFHRWTFTPAELAPHAFTTALGTGYNLILDWKPRRFPADRVTIIARYQPDQGPPVTSAPSSITASAY